MSVFNPLTSNYSTQLFAAIGKKLYMNSESADVHFVFESNDDIERVPAHKAHLMVGSDVFAKMFNGSWKEMDKVKIGDVSASAFKEFLQFFYVGQVKLTMENIAAVMNLGEMYNVTECLAVCTKFLKNNLNDENVCSNYELAILLNQEGLKKACEIFIGLNIKAVFKSTDFQTCDRKMLAQILKLNWMSCTEVDLFEACMSWVKVASKQDVLTKETVQAHLGDLFHEIRFGSMSLQMFAALIPTYGSTFSLDEHQEIIQMIADPTFQSTIFNGNRLERCNTLDLLHESNEIFCGRLISNYYSSEPYKIKNIETTVFSTNESLLLRAIGCGNIQAIVNKRYFVLNDGVPTKITIVEKSETNNEVIVFNANGILNSREFVRISLTKPIRVKSGFTYEIRLEQTSENCYTGGLLKSSVELESGIIIQFHRDSVLEKDPTVARGLIYSLFFQKI
ncbi:BTB/POZ domain-containing protein 6-A-like isoform X2 [Sitodiplosis mosellana]|uniref:BTB/POZ domain-containing protein 6-A-like isoform X2 n=1 Tax=Sitodiplosis mosellana TaxID=263140 RepID=UPI0024453645|nr:BTB/POZ domain-containing protein 6-A-like isoform X2 [Sitodiplosis mosellana]XP_055303139.1 BTB/POZ domain-containing protein 6-A-like isoform X2 [Sitodiplosis mosellana]